MSSPTFSLLQRLFDRAAALDGDDRETFLANEAEHSPDLVEKVRDLLRADELLADRMTLHAVAPPGNLEPARPVARIGPFAIREVLGRGGMGTVYRGERMEGGVEQQVAVKLLHGSWKDEVGRYRFSVESQILARLDHPGIARWIDAGETADGHRFLAMEYVSGTPISTYCQEQRASLEHRLELFRQACAAVSFAHRHLILHRDLKPDHILVNNEGHVKLVDFGIAKPLTDQLGQILVEQTATQGRVFSPLYAAPEQILGEPSTVATDVYGLGGVLYDLLTHSPALELAGSSLRQVEDRVLDEEPEAPSQRLGSNLSGDATASTGVISAQLRGDLDSIVLKCLQKSPAARYATVAELDADIDRFLNQRPVVAREGRWTYRAGKLLRRHRASLGAMMALVLALGLGLIAFFWQSVETAKQRDRAQLVTEFMVSAFESADPSNSLGTEVTASQILEQSLRQIDHDPPDSPETRAELLLAIARVQASLGLGSEAWSTLQRAAESYRAGAGDADLETRILTAQVRQRLDKGEPEAARELATQALGRDGLGEQQRLHLEYCIGFSFFLSSDFERSRAYFEKLLLRLRSRSLAESAVGFEIRRGHARSIEALGQFEEAASLFEAILQSQRQQLGHGHPEVLQSLLSLSTVYSRLYRPQEARRVTQSAVELTTRLYGEGSLPHARALGKLAGVAARLGDYRQAVEHTQAALAIRQQRYGKEHKSVAMSWFNLALYSAELPELVDLQDESFRSAIAAGSAVWAEDHRNLHLFGVAYALFLNEHGRFEKALEQVTRALAIAETRPEYKDYDVYSCGQLARAVAQLSMVPSPRNKRDVEHWLEMLRGELPHVLTQAKRQAKVVEAHGVVVPPEILAASNP